MAGGDAVTQRLAHLSDQGTETDQPAAVGARTRQLSGVGGILQYTILGSIPVLGLTFIMGWHISLGLVVYREQWAGLLLTLFFVGAFLTFPASRSVAQTRSRHLPWYDWFLAGLGCLPGGFLAWQYPVLVFQLGSPSPVRTLLGLLTVLLLAEALRRIVGWSLVIVLIAFVLYGLTSDRFPGILQGQPVSTDRLLNYVYVDPSAILGMLALAATYGVAFVTFGQVLLYFGAGATMTDLAILGFGRFRGGGSKAAVVASSLAGTVSGGAMSNVLLTGTVTIPLMKRTGYRASVAAATEALASSGGQIMPPVMGIAAFLIAENLGVPYAEIALAALIPAILLYLTLFLTTDLEAGKSGLSRIPKSDMPVRSQTLARSWVLLPTLGLLIYLLFFRGLEPTKAAALATFASVPIMLAFRRNRGEALRGIPRMLRDTGTVVLDLVGVLAVAGVVVGVVSLTGLGFQFAYGALQLAGGNVLLLLLAAAVAAIILGMGMPSVAAYALVAVLIVPGLIAGGIEPLAAHMFVFYFAVISNITPPIAVAVFAAAALAGAGQMRSAVDAMRLGWSFFLIPFLFVISPSLLLEGTTREISLVTATVVAGIVMVSIGAAGFIRARVGPSARLVCLLAGAALIYPFDALAGVVVNCTGALVGLVVFIVEFRKADRSRIPGPQPIAVSHE